MEATAPAATESSTVGTTAPAATESSPLGRTAPPDSEVRGSQAPKASNDPEVTPKFKTTKDLPTARPEEGKLKVEGGEHKGASGCG